MGWSEKDQSMSSETQILIVDDHPMVRRGLSDMLSREPGLKVCAEASHAGEALEKASAARPDLIIIDLSLQEGSGLELIKQIRAQSSDVKMLVVSMHDEKLFAERALHAGAQGYINKGASPEEFIQAIRSVLKGKVYLSPQMTERVLERCVDQDSAELSASPIESLTDRELEVFLLIGQGLTTRQIAEHLSLSVKTIETHRDSIKQKLNVRTGAELNRQAVAWSLEQKLE